MFRSKAPRITDVVVVTLLLLAAAAGGARARGLAQAVQPATEVLQQQPSLQMQNQTQLQQQQPDDTFDPEDSPMKLAVKQMSGLLSKVPKDVLKNVTLASMRPRNWTLPANFSQQVVSALRNMSVVENGMTALEVAKALMTGTISSNTADANTPDIGLSDVQSGAININPFIDGAAMSNALTLAGREATANSRGIVFGMVGTGRSSNDATALGRTGAASSTDAFVINGGGLNQNAMSSNLALTPQGPADTSVRAASFNIIGGTTSGGLTNAIGKKGADSAGLGATMTGLGDSYSSQFANSVSQGATSANTGVIAGTLTGASKGTVGSVATSAKSDADTQALATSKSAIGSSTSKSASLSVAAQNASSSVGSDAFSGVGNSASMSSTHAAGLDATAHANSTATSQAGAANSLAVSRATGITGARASSDATSRPSETGLRRSVVLATQLRLPSTSLSVSSSRSGNLQAGGLLGSLLPGFMRTPDAPRAAPSLPTTGPLLGEALVSTVGLKALLPSVPVIIPQLPTLNQTITVEAAPPCNETEINADRGPDQTWLTCNSTANGTETADTPDPTAAAASSLPGLGFFKNLRDMNDKFVEETKRPPSPPAGAKAPAPAGAKSPAVPAGSTAPVKVPVPPAGGKPAAGGGGSTKPSFSPKLLLL